VITIRTSKAYTYEFKSGYTGLTEDLKTLLPASIHSFSNCCLCHCSLNLKAFNAHADYSMFYFVLHVT